MFRALAAHSHDKTICITDSATDMTLFLDTDDVNPDDVTPENIERIIKALNAEFYG